jgi:response regulator RpfG family c-di-GMP phosphodiesterase
MVDDARAELAAVNETCAGAKARVLDPFSISSVVTKAKKELEDLSLQVARLEAAVDRLAGQLEAAQTREGEAARVKLYDEAKAERDALEEDIRRIYPEAAATIAALLVRIEAADQKVAAANERLPAHALWLEPVEMVVRGRPPHEGSPLSCSVRLPALLHQETYWNSFWPIGQQ